jgi:small-conductance mechanosensitive channel/CRP-like cAMP-binding protein
VDARSFAPRGLCGGAFLTRVNSLNFTSFYPRQLVDGLIVLESGNQLGSLGKSVVRPLDYGTDKLLSTAQALTQLADLFADPLAQFVVLAALRGFGKLLFPAASLCRLLLNITFFALLTALLLYHDIPPYSPDALPLSVAVHVSNGVMKTVWWIGGAMVLVSSVRMFLILEQKPREGRLLQDLVIALIYLGAALCIVAFVFDLPVGTVIATSGVFAIVLGLALQSTLNDVFSGIALNLGRPLSVGDWIVLEDDIHGRVIETNWRSTQFLNKTGDLVVVPNSVLAKSRITNLSVPDTSHGATLKVKLQTGTQPRVILDLMDRVLLSSNEIMKSPAPSASILGIDMSTLEVELSFRVTNIGHIGRARNELFDLIYRHMEAAGLQLAPGPDAGPATIAKSASARADALRRLLASIPLFASLTDDETAALSANMNRLSFKKGELMAHKDASLTSLMILRSGVAVFIEPSDETSIELGRIAPGDLFGERGVLLGALELCDVKAMTSVVVYEIPKTQLAAILRERPVIAEELALLLATRTKAEEAFHEMGRLQPSGSVMTLRARIRQLFHL